MFPAVKGNSSTSVGSVDLADILWESFGTEDTPSRGDIITKVYYSDEPVSGTLLGGSRTSPAGFISFTVPSELKNGNAVIVAKDTDLNILWSWHIWVCKDFDPVASAQEYFNSAGKMMDRNLGATSAKAGEVGALGLLYQWGRKDPFLGGWQISSNSQAKSTLSWPDPVNSNSNIGTVDYAVKNPTTFIKGVTESQNDWVYSSRLNALWQSAKTIYDPCPAGWKVPEGGETGVWYKAAGNISSFPYNSTYKGMNFSEKFGSASSIWYPAAGYLLSGGGSLNFVGDSGTWWSCTPNGDDAYRLYLNYYGNVGPSGSNYRATGRSVRCLQE